MKYLIEESGIYKEVESTDIVDILDDNIVEVEERVIYIDIDHNFSISVDGDGKENRGFIKDPYFKFHKSKSTNKGEVVRISFTGGKPRYVVHKHDTGVLNSKERKYLEDAMDKQSNLEEYKGVTVWEAIKKAAQEESNNATKEDKDRINSLKRPSFKDIQPAK